MGRDSLERKQIERELDVDTSKLYASLDTCIKYLKEIKEAHPDKELSLDEKWTGYEDMYMRFVYYSLETDEEYDYRLRVEEGERQRQETIRKNKEKEKKYLKEMQELRKKYGK